jgi:hypothetical protein
VVVVVAVAARPHGEALLVVVVFLCGISEAHVEVWLCGGLRGVLGLFCLFCLFFMMCLQMDGREAKVKRENMEITGVRWLNGHAGGEVESSLGLEFVMGASVF